MNRWPNDFDIATMATPDQVTDLFPQSLEVGKSYGVTIIPFDGFNLEVATFREDLSYKDGRRPEGVIFSSPQADANRRDFTVNAIFYDLENKKVIDYVDGQRDIRAGVIRTVGEPKKRFEEDQLRLLRAVRFAAQLDFVIEESTFRAVIELANKLSTVSRERVRDELLKTLSTAKRVRGLELLQGTGLLNEVSPALFEAATKRNEAWLRSFELLPPDEKSPSLLLALLFWPLFEDAGHRWRNVMLTELKMLRLDNRLIDEIMFALQNSQNFLEPELVRRGEMALLLAHPAAQVAERLAMTIEAAREIPPADVSERKSYLADLRRIALTDEGEKPVPLIRGEDAKQMGLKPGPRLGALLHEAYLLQLEKRFNSRDEALEWLKARISHT
jgi:tRNA nucleotidyltransferase (CCA-adding enzyme)